MRRTTIFSVIFRCLSPQQGRSDERGSDGAGGTAKLDSHREETWSTLRDRDPANPYGLDRVVRSGWILF
ncbi:MAG TPA: hypothetical protein VM782_04860 [Stellaceae bacterium]|nr:hypothetical protein [Stellaceae bacterium]